MDKTASLVNLLINIVMGIVLGITGQLLQGGFSILNFGQSFVLSMGVGYLIGSYIPIMDIGRAFAHSLDAKKGLGEYVLSSLVVFLIMVVLITFFCMFVQAGTQLSHPSARKRNTLEKGKYSAKYVLSDIMICAECGQPYRRQVWSKYGVKRAVLRCDNRLKHGSRFCKHSLTLRETTLHEAVMAAINKVVEDQGEFVKAFRENVIHVIGSYSAKGDPTEYDAQIENPQQHVIELIEESVRMGWTDEESDREYQRVVGKIKELKKQRAKVVQECNLADSYEQNFRFMSW